MYGLLLGVWSVILAKINENSEFTGMLLQMSTLPIAFDPSPGGRAKNSCTSDKDI